MFRFSVKQDTVLSLYSLLTILAELSSALYYVDGLPRFDEKKTCGMNVELALTSVYPLHSHPVRRINLGYLNNFDENGRSVVFQTSPL